MADGAPDLVVIVFCRPPPGPLETREEASDEHENKMILVASDGAIRLRRRKDKLKRDEMTTEKSCPRDKTTVEEGECLVEESKDLPVNACEYHTYIFSCPLAP